MTRQSLNDFDDSTVAPTSRWQLLAPLLLAALRNPVQTLGLLSFARIKNLYVTLFRQPAEMRESIVSYYVDLYEAADDGPPETVSEALPELPLCFPSRSAVPLVSIVVPAHNHYETTLRCLDAVLRNTREIAYELILADDASSDATRTIEHVVENVQVVRNEENIGFLHTCNRALRSATGRWLVLLNNDTLVTDGWLSQLLRLAERYPNVGMVGPKLLYPNGKLQEAGGIVWRDGSAWNYGRGGDPRRPEYNYVRDVDYVSGACICVRRKLWQQFDGFDPRFAPAYYEDTDLAFAIRAHGYRVMYQPQSVVVHVEGVSHGKDPAVGIKGYQQRNAARFAEKWRSVLRDGHLPAGSDLHQARERTTGQKTMLIIDHRVPRQDRDAGSRSTYQYIRWFLQCGLRVKFIGDDFHFHRGYTEALQQLGVEVLYGPWYARNWKEWLRTQGADLDYVYLHRPQVASKYLAEIRRSSRAKVLYFGHDLHYLRVHRQAQQSDETRLADEVERWRDMEFEVFRQADVIYYPSDVETREVLRSFPDKTVRSIPLYLTDGVAEMPEDYQDRHGLLFVAGFAHPPNLDAFDWFVSDILPRIHASLPDCRVAVVGSNVPQQVKQHAGAMLDVHENVSDETLDAIYRSSRLAVVPLRYGAGIKGKILEAMQLQLPVVTTSIGAEGLPDAERYLTIADTAEAFAQQLVGLYQSHETWMQYREQGRRAFNAYFGKRRAAEILGQDIALDLVAADSHEGSDAEH